MRRPIFSQAGTFVDFVPLLFELSVTYPVGEGLLLNLLPASDEFSVGRHGVVVTLTVESGLTIARCRSAFDSEK